MSTCGFRRGFIHWQHSRRLGLGLAGFAALGAALIDARGTGTRFAQPCKSPCAFVPIGPVDFKALALGEKDAHLLRSDSDAGERSIGLVLACLLAFRHEADA